jgi:hypothetical protein
MFQRRRPPRSTAVSDNLRGGGSSVVVGLKQNRLIEQRSGPGQVPIFRQGDRLTTYHSGHLALSLEACSRTCLAFPIR